MLPADPNDPPKIVAAGKAVAAAAGAGLPLACIATLVATPLNIIVVLKDNQIRRLADLKDKRVGFSVAVLDDAGVLSPHGLTMNDIVKVNVNWSLSPSGQVDAVIGAICNFYRCLPRVLEVCVWSAVHALASSVDGPQNTINGHL